MQKELIELPKNVVTYTLSFLDLPSLFNFSVTCKKGSSLFKEETLWRLLCLRDHEEGEIGGEDSWKEKYKNLQDEWDNTGEEIKYKTSENGKFLISQKVETVIGKTKKPLRKNRVHKSE